MLAFVTTASVLASSSLHVLHVGQPQQPRKLAEPARWGFPSWTPDGRTILFVRGSDEGTEIVTVPSDASVPPGPIRRIPHLRGTVSLSPDGNLLAYEVGPVGRELVMVTNFPDFSSQVQISGEGAKNPEWSPNGDEVWFTQGNRLLAVPITKSNGHPVPGSTRTLLTPPPEVALSYRTIAGGKYYATVDGKKFLVTSSRIGGEPRVTLIQNAPELLRRARR